jgi:hypothetical protein
MGTSIQIVRIAYAPVAIQIVRVCQVWTQSFRVNLVRFTPGTRASQGIAHP